MHLALLMVASLVSQAPASPVDFSGTWKMVADRSGSAELAQPIMEMTFVIAQSADSVRLDMTSGHDEMVSVTFPFGPAPKPPAEPLGGGQKLAYWDGRQLVVARGGIISGQTVSSKQTLTLSADQSEMTVERVVIVQHGYTLRGTPNYASVKDVFARVK